MFIEADKISNTKIYRRIISLVPSQTELLFDLGLEQEIVGITKFCIHPYKWFKEKTRVGGTKTVNIKLIHRLNPDLIIANKEENAKEQIEELSTHFDVYLSEVNNLSDATQMIKSIGKLTDKHKEATSLVNNIVLKFQSLSDIDFYRKKIKAAYVIWKDPYMVAANKTFINDMMKYCGLENFYENKERYPEIILDELKDTIASNAGCGLILLSSEPYPFKEKHIKEIQAKISCSKILLADGEMFSWYGSRLLKAADYFKNLRSDIETMLDEKC